MLKNNCFVKTKKSVRFLSLTKCKQKNLSVDEIYQVKLEIHHGLQYGVKAVKERVGMSKTVQ